MACIFERLQSETAILNHHREPFCIASAGLMLISRKAFHCTLTKWVIILNQLQGQLRTFVSYQAFFSRHTPHCTFYKSTICPSIEFCSHSGAPAMYPEILKRNVDEIWVI